MRFAASALALFLFARPLCLAAIRSSLRHRLLIRPDPNRLGARDLDETLLTPHARFGSAALLVRAIRMQFPCFHVVGQVRGEDLILDACAKTFSEDREHKLDATEKVARHPVAARSVDLCLTAVSKQKNSRVLEEPINDRHDADVL